MISFGQTSTSATESDFRNGYITGFKKGFCIDDMFCNPPFSIEVPIWGKIGFNTYSDGYSKGVVQVKLKKTQALITLVLMLLPSERGLLHLKAHIEMLVQLMLALDLVIWRPIVYATIYLHHNIPILS